MIFEILAQVHNENEMKATIMLSGGFEGRKRERKGKKRMDGIEVR